MFRKKCREIAAGTTIHCRKRKKREQRLLLIQKSRENG